MRYVSVYPSPVGKLTVIADETALLAVHFDNETVGTDGFSVAPSEIIASTEKWLDEYFSGKIPAFTPNFRFEGSPFRVAVWEEIARIPYGKTTTYGEIAKKVAAKLGKPRMSAQAVGGATGANRIPIIVPCHRVMGADGSLTGFSAGLDKKKILLDLERINYKDRRRPENK